MLETLETRRLLHAPEVDAISNYNVPIGKFIQIPLTATYDHADKVVWTVTDNNSNVIETVRAQTNTFIEMTVSGYSETMVFELFNDVAPDTVRRMVGLINAGYFDGQKFHRVINNFMLQGGDPKSKTPYVDSGSDGIEQSGDNIWGTGGPSSTFNDEFDIGTTFTGDGQLAMANTGKDTNGSQFFITEGPQRFLDFNHTIWGQLVRGFATRNSVSNVSVNSLSQPVSDVTISRVRVIQNTTDAVLSVKVSAATTGTITVTATGAEGGSQQTFTVTGVADTSNSPPILSPISDLRTGVGQAITISLASLDPEGDAVAYSGQFINQAGASGSVDGNKIIVTPSAGYTGAITLYVGVVASGASSRGSTDYNANAPLGGIYDLQKVTIAVGDLPATATALTIDAPIGVPVNTVPVATFVDSDPNGLVSSWSAAINWGDATVTTGTIVKGSDGTFTIYGSHTYANSVSAAAYPITVDITGNRGSTARANSSANVRSFAAVSGGVLTINGSTVADKIGLSSKSGVLTVGMNGVSRTFSTSSINKIVLLGYASKDYIALANASMPPANIDGGSGNDTIYGGSGNDTINGSTGVNVIYGNDGDDKIAGGASADTIYGGVGRDRISGLAGNDLIYGDAGHDIISGNDGDDILVGGPSGDNIYGDAGNDTINGLSGADTLDGGIGTDQTKRDDLDTRIAIEVLV